MKNRYLWLILVGLVALLMAVSCKSSPPPAELVPPEGVEEVDPDNLPPDAATLNNLNAAADRAAAARKLVSDFDGPRSFPQDWQTADSMYAQAEALRKTGTRRETNEAAARYNAAANSFDAMKDKTLVQYHDNKQRELLNARNGAVAVGAAALIPDYLLEVDNIAAGAQAKYEAKDYYGARDDANKALSMYEAQKTAGDAWNLRAPIAAKASELVPGLLQEADNVGLDAVDKYLAGDYRTAKDGAAKAGDMYAVLGDGLDSYKVREEIAARNFERFDPANVRLADDTLSAAAADYEAGNYAGARDKIDTAAFRYNLALKTAWQSYAQERRDVAVTQRQRALDLKANVAVRQEFNDAQSLYTRANTAFQGQRHEEAALLYDDCIASFEAASRMAYEKQRLAEDALRRANQRMAESDETARAAEIILEGGAQ